jgi:uncharacterized membrane protein
VHSFVWAAAGAASLALAAPAASACEPRTSVLKSPRAGSKEVQAKALNDRGDIVGFADGRDGRFRAVLWRAGKVSRAVVLGVLPGYVSSEAYAVNNDRVVFGLLYDRRDRTFPFRWRNGRMTLLKGPTGRREEVAVPDRNAINERGEIAGTLTGGGRRRAVRWGRRGRATLLPPLPGHTWTNAWSIGPTGVVSGWSRRLPNEDGENNPVIWTRSGAVTALGTAPGRADGAAEATNRLGLTVGYLGNLGTETDPENDFATVWARGAVEPQFLERATLQDTYAELVDVNDRAQAAGMSGTFTSTGFPRARPAVWQTGAPGLRLLPVPRATRRHRVLSTELHDVNARGDIVGDVFGLSAAAFDNLQRVYPVRWTCPFGR